MTKERREGCIGFMRLLLTLIALFAIVSPITSLPVFLNLTSEMTKSQRRITALKTAGVAGLTLIIAYFLGDIILRSLSIDMNSFKIAGAFVICAYGWSMVMGKKPREVKAAPAGAAVVPLAIPMMAGPGAIATVIALGNNAAGSGLGLSITRRIAELHGGSVELQENKTGPGLTAGLRLPRQAAAA